MTGRPFEKGKSGNPGGRPRVIVELRELARRQAPDAIKELGRLALKARSETARIAAIRELLDRGYGKPTQILAAEEAAEPGIRQIEVRFVPPPKYDDDDEPPDFTT
jgi:hypothetical protein